jgi:hypothetical protein
MLLMSDGTLFVPYADYPFLPEKAKLNTSSTFWFVTSRDGGVTFSSPGKIAVQTHPDQERYQKLRKEGSFISSGFPMFAIDASSGSTKDRIYCLWMDDRTGKPRVFISRSSDVGATWSEPALVDPSVPDGASQFQPMISVNKDGAVAAMGYDTRSSRADDRFDLYLSASVNGGESFLPPVRVSTGSSFPRAGMNLTPATFWVERSAQSIKMTGISAFSRWPHGGDYIGLTADAEGTFHPFWADSRDGVYQIYTCPVVVRIDPETHEAAPARLEPAPPSLPRIKAALNDKVELVFDPARYDLSNGTATLFIRIKNASKAVSGAAAAARESASARPICCPSVPLCGRRLVSASPRLHKAPPRAGGRPGFEGVPGRIVS